MQTVTFIKKNVLAATRVKVKCSMHQKEKPVLFMPVPYRSIDMLLVKAARNFSVPFGKKHEIRCFLMKYLRVRSVKECKI